MCYLKQFRNTNNTLQLEVRLFLASVLLSGVDHLSKIHLLNFLKYILARSWIQRALCICIRIILCKILRNRNSRFSMCEDHSICFIKHAYKGHACFISPMLAKYQYLKVIDILSVIQDQVPFGKKLDWFQILRCQVGYTVDSALHLRLYLLISASLSGKDVTALEKYLIWQLRVLASALGN